MAGYEVGRASWDYEVRNNANKSDLYHASNQSYEGFLSRQGTEPWDNPFY